MESSPLIDRAMAACADVFHDTRIVLAYAYGSRVDVDLRHLGAAPLEWRARVLQRGRRIHCTDEVARVTLERQLLVRWFDEQPRIERFHETRLASYAVHGLTPGYAP